MKHAIQDQVGDQSRRADQQFFRLLFALIVFGAVALFSLAYFSFRDLDTLAADNQRARIEAAIAVETDRLISINREYSLWTESHEKSVLSQDSEWADSNIGRYLHETYDIARVFVIRGDQLLWSFVDGKPLTPSQTSAPSPMLLKLVRENLISKDYQYRNAGYINIAGENHLAIVGAFANDITRQIIGDDSVLVTTQRLDEAYLSKLIKSYRLPDMWFDQDPHEHAQSAARFVGIDLNQHGSLPLLAPDEQQLLSISWELHRPSIDFIQDLLVPGGIVMLIGLGLLLAILQNYRGQRNRQLNELGRLNKQLQIAEAQATQNSRSKSSFLATMSHEIRTPLNGILGMAQLLSLHNSITAEEQKRSVRVILESGQQLLKLLNDILDLSKVEAGKLELQYEPFSPHDLLNDVAALFRQASKNKQLSLIVMTDIPRECRFSGDALRLRQMLANLVSNAIKFSQDGEVKISVKVDDHAEQARLTFAVEDSGVGIPKDKLSQLFQTFSQVGRTANRDSGSSGLGLSIISQLARLMGGEVGVESQTGKGSTFWFCIPAERLTNQDLDSTTSADADPQNAGSSEPDQHIQFSGHVLVVDDDDASRRSLLGLLQCHGLLTTEVADGRQALEMFIAGHQFDLVFMDLHMREMDGISASTRIHAWQKEQQQPLTPIAAVTADAYKEARQDCAAAGMVDFISKPLQLTDMLSVLKRLLPTVQVGPTGSTTLTDSDLLVIQEMLQRLAPMLQQSLFDALPLFEKIQQICLDTVLEAPITVIGNSIKALEFDLAHQKLQAFCAEQNWPMST